jgi:molecular chaperone Hsp33
MRVPSLLKMVVAWKLVPRRQVGAFMVSTTRSRGITSRLYSSNSSSSDQKTTKTVHDNSLEQYRNTNNVRDQVFSAMSADGGIKVTAATVRNMVNDLMIQHEMSKVSADALGRTVICGVLMTNGIQDEQIVQITMQSDGPIRGVVAIVNGLGEVRGYVGSPMLGEMPLPEAIGKGSVQIVKNHPAWPRPYNGVTRIEHGDIDRDIGIYLAQSEQRSCALAAATFIEGYLCKAAGGYLIEQLPDVDKATVAKVSENLESLVKLDGGDNLPSNLLLSGKTPLDIAEIILEGLDMVPLQQIEPALKCDCSEERLMRSLRLLPREDVDDILSKQEKVEAKCEFCGTTYGLTPAEVRERLEVIGDPASDDV